MFFDQSMTFEIHASMKMMFDTYIKALKDSEDRSESNPQPSVRRWRPSAEQESKKRHLEEARQKAKAAAEEMEGPWEHALRLLTHIFTIARGNFACHEYKLIPDRSSWLVRASIHVTAFFISCTHHSELDVL